MKRIALAIAAVLLAAPATRADEVRLISTADLEAKTKAAAWDFVLVDSRTETEFAEGHIHGAVLVPAKKTAEKMPTTCAQKDKLVIFYCNGPDCPKSRKAYKAAAALGYTNLREYNEGLPAWAAAGHKVEGTPLPEFTLPAGVKPKDLATLISGGTPKVVDVRDADEFATFHIKGALNVPVDSLQKRAAELPEGPIVIVDHVGHQVKVAARLLAKLGHKDLKWLDGGLLAWSDAGLPTEGK
jgi:rhodanese-related sulfurtransferase